ncbi:protein phosphatase 2C domain-containing protein [Actinokineospora sp. NBRC 105648]|uniref:protein phosphatase 2C domain-containing protein n=1 Tax=Actinokineospora sp. NBRC 105648 TaxID=3032206 RepID=UPI0024A26019|nr:protein phosphatase 2C domain-containing protein [Actinokineospora sp. NBRC 105648]GLZ43182.1 hypothetical protein Acsp05_68060 [Actinokineospora sp. NBRC 105648]
MSESVDCRHCTAPVQPGRHFCEHCGAEQRMLFSGPAEALDLRQVAGITDRGRRRDHNEDAVAVGTLGPLSAAVVCDGVASSPGSAAAASHAVQAGLRGLLDAAARGEDPSIATTAGALAGAAAAAALGDPSDDNPPCTTYVSALAAEDEAAVGWVGDSAAYWAGPEGLSRLTVDDSAAGRLTAAGVQLEDPRLADPTAHALERWLGADAGEVVPQVYQFTPPTPGLILVCSDGLSRYLDAGLVVLADYRGRPAEIAQELLTDALEVGGHDNVTIAVIACQGPLV